MQSSSDIIDQSSPKSGILDACYSQEFAFELPSREFQDSLPQKDLEFFGIVTLRVVTEPFIRFIGSDKEDFRLAMVDKTLLFFDAKDEDSEQVLFVLDVRFATLKKQRF